VQDQIRKIEKRRKAVSGKALRANNDKTPITPCEKRLILREFAPKP
jgi:hypothetical protein